MGGFGSGFQGRRRRTVEEALNIDVRALVRAGLFEDGAGERAWRWRDGRTGVCVGAAWVGVEQLEDGSHELCAMFSQGGASRLRRARVTWRPCHFGNKRPLLVCPSCARPRFVLFLPELECRECLNLGYYSQQTTEAALVSARAKMVRAARACGLELSDAETRAPDLHWRALSARLERPRGAWRSTWVRRVGELHAAYADTTRVFIETFAGCLPGR